MLNPEQCVAVACIGDNLWVVLVPYHYLTGSGRWVVVPKGFQTDGASVPRALWSAIPPTGLHFNAAVIHDCLYRSTDPNKPAKAECDRIFLEVMERDQVPPERRLTMFEAVQLCGESSYVCGTGTAAPDRGEGRRNSLEMGTLTDTDKLT